MNLGTGKGYSVREVITMIERVSGRKVPVRQALRRAGDPSMLVAGAHRARELMEWQPQHSSLQTIISTAWRWHAARHEKVSRGQVPVLSFARQHGLTGVPAV